MSFRSLATLWFVLHAGALAQFSPEPPGNLPAPPFAAEGQEKPENADTTINFPNSPVSDFLDLYESLQGVPLIKDASLTAGGNLSLMTVGSVTKKDAIRLIEATLLLNGYAFIAVDNPRREGASAPLSGEEPEKPFAIKVINTQGGKNPRSEGVKVFTEEDKEQLPDSEVIASFIMPLKALGATEAVDIFNQFIVLHPYGSMVAVPINNQVLITENASLIRRLLKVRDIVDKPAAEPENEFVQLRQANAEKVVKLISKVLEKRAAEKKMTAGRAATGQATPPPGVPLPGVSATGTEGGGITINMGEGGSVRGDIQLIADVRTNRILIVTRPNNLAYIKDLIEKFDVPVELTDPYEKKLNYISASEVLPALVAILTEPEGDNTQGDPRSAQSGGIGTAVGQAVSSALPMTGAPEVGPSISSIPDRLREPGMEKALEPVVVGTTRIIADNRANSILVIGQPEARENVGRILEKLDKRPLQVYIATVIGNLTVDDNDTFSANILSKYIGGPKTGAAAVAGGRRIIDGGTNGVTPLSPAAATLSQMAQVASSALPGMQVATFIAGSLDIYIQALTATAKFRVAARPAIFTANNKKATIFNGREIAVPTSTVTTLGAGASVTTSTGSQQSNITYKPVVLKIEVVPLINNQDEITLRIVQTNNKVIPGATTEVGGGVAVPEISTQELTTTVTIPDQGTILLGGLITQTDEKNIAGVPFLSSVPLMGNLFRSTTDTTRKEELVVMIQPSIVSDMLEIDTVSKTERDLTDFSSKDLSSLSMKMREKPPQQEIQLQLPAENLEGEKGGN